MTRRIVLTVLTLLVLTVVGLFTWTRISPTQVRSEIEINATPERVWQTLTDFSSYKDWNPFMVSATGEATVGARLRNTLKDNGQTTVIEPTVLVADVSRELRWIGRFGMPGIVDGEHWFRIEALPGGHSKLVQGETFTGVLVPFAGKALEVEDNFAAMNTALKNRVEKMGT